VVRLKADTTYKPRMVRLKADTTYKPRMVRLKADTTYKWSVYGGTRWHGVDVPDVMARLAHVAPRPAELVRDQGSRRAAERALGGVGRRLPDVIFVALNADNIPSRSTPFGHARESTRRDFSRCVQKCTSATTSVHRPPGDLSWILSPAYHWPRI